MYRDDTDASADRPSRVTLRAVLIGLVFVAGLGFVIPFVQDLRAGADLGLGPVNGASILVLIILLGPINGLLLWLRRRASLARNELLVIYCMVAITAAIVGVGFATWVNVMVTASQYLATPENRWEVLIQPHVPTWMQVSDPVAIRWLWEGLPDGRSVPWQVWRSPLLAWGAIAACIYVGSFCLMSLVRREWIESQRLVFPLAQIPLEMVGHRGPPGVSLLGRPAFWVGFAIAFAYGVIALLHSYFPAVPYHDLRWQLGQSINPNSVPWGPLHNLRFHVTLAAIGIMCLVPLEVSLSFWLFNLFDFAVLVCFSALGFGQQGAARYGFSPGAFMDFQTGGALIGFGVLLLWQSRRAILAAVRSWWDPRWGGDDPLELLRPQYALLGLVISTAGLCLVANMAGAQMHRLLVLLFMYYMTALSLTRVVAAAGTNHVECGPQIRYLLDYGVGTLGARPGSFVLMNQMDAVFMTEFKVAFMHYAANDMKILHARRLRGTSAVAALAAAVLVMLVVGSMSRVYTNYHLGLGRVHWWISDMVPRWEWGDVADNLQNPRPPDVVGIVAMVTGGLVASALALLQTHVSWWRLSPVGFLFQPATGLNWYIWANAFVGWVIVTTAFRLGGLRLYRQARPAFLGLFLGGTTAMLVSNLIRLLSHAPGSWQIN